MRAGEEGWVAETSSRMPSRHSAGGEYAGVPCRYHGRMEARGCALAVRGRVYSKAFTTETRRHGGRRRRKDGERHGGRPLPQRTQRTPRRKRPTPGERHTARSPSESRARYRARRHVRRTNAPGGATSSEVLITNGGWRRVAAHLRRGGEAGQRPSPPRAPRTPRTAKYYWNVNGRGGGRPGAGRRRRVEGPGGRRRRRPRMNERHGP